MIFNLNHTRIFLERKTRFVSSHLTFIALIPQLAERWTAEFIQVIHRSLVQIRLEEADYSNEPMLVTNGLPLLRCIMSFVRAAHDYTQSDYFLHPFSNCK